MNAITQIITQQLTGSASQQIAARLGISEGTANMAVQRSSLCKGAARRSRPWGVAHH